MGRWVKENSRAFLKSNFNYSLFKKLIFKPDTTLKHRRIALMFLIWSPSTSQNIKESSVNCECLALPTSMILWLRTSLKSTKRKGESRFPCLRPLEAAKNPSGVPLINTVKEVKQAHSFIRWHIRMPTSPTHHIKIIIINTSTF